METTRGAFHPTRFRDLAVTVDFHCNSACRFCIVQEGMNRYRGVPLERFRATAAENRVSRKYERVLFTGGEVTLEKSLFDFVRVARESESFAHVRVQTNGRRLADAAYARALREAGVDELFVSVHGADARTHDGITQRPGSFDELVRGLDNARALGFTLLSNTVITALNVQELAAIMELAAAHGVTSAELWGYLPMADHAEANALLAPVSEVAPALLAALDSADALGVAALVKYVPHCLLGTRAALVDNAQPDVIIVESFWDAFPKFSCLFEAVCEHSDSCLGLSHAYIDRFGWEETRLRPEPRVTPWKERDAPAEQATVDDGDPARDRHGVWGRLLAGVEDAEARLAGVQVSRTQVRYGFELGAGARLDVVLEAHDPAKQALARTRSFNLFYAGLEGDPSREQVRGLLERVVAAVQRGDDGTLFLDGRKGLLPLVDERPRRAPRPPR